MKTPSRLLVIAILVLALFAAFGCRAKRVPEPSFKSPQIMAECVMFRYCTPNATSASVIGTFNSWRPTGESEMKKSESGIWEVCIRLGPGTYEYLFLVDGAKRVWDPKNPERISDRSDGHHSVITVGRY
ncbi:glycogen-binding domain-containing protein [bacterium]|nr:glycogen-binding domain-containing protein [bacterium]